MNGKQNKKLIPELRFPEFKNSGEWVEKKISDLLEYERPDKYIVSDTNYKKEGIPVLTANKAFILGYTNEDYGIYDNLPAIIFDDFTVDNKYVDFPFKVKSSAIKILTPKNNNNLKFIFESMSFIKFDATQHKRYYISEYQNLKIPVPSLPEQQKIAAFLSNLDELIDAHKQKLEGLKQHKKGLMQNLFPQEGKKIPKLRFPEFQNSGEWVEKTISQIGTTLNGLSGKKSSDFGNGKPYIQYKQVFDKSYINYSECGKVNIEEDENQNTVQKGDILFTTSSETPNEVGFASVIIDEPKESTYLNSFCFILRPFNLYELEPSFSRFLFRSPTYRKSVSKVAQGSTRFNLSKSHFLKLKIPVPSLPEQQKIAAFLSNLDELIEAVEKKIELLEQHKKGLMQKMFPQVKQ